MRVAGRIKRGKANLRIKADSVKTIVKVRDFSLPRLPKIESIDIRLKNPIMVAVTTIVEEYEPLTLQISATDSTKSFVDKALMKFRTL